MEYVVSLDGPDNIGKTTLVQLFSKKYKKSTILRFDAPKDKSEGKERILDFLRTDFSQVTFVDRSPLEEFVYGSYRGYDAYQYWDEIAIALKETLVCFVFVFLYADSGTYDKFVISPKKDEGKDYQKKSLSRKISLQMLRLARRLESIHNVKCVYINCNNYDSLDQRNKHIVEKIESIIRREPTPFVKIKGYQCTFFDPYQATIDCSKNTFGISYPSVCDSYFDCPLGRENESSKFGLQYHCPTFGCGSVDAKYIFIAEAPGRAGCGIWGIPFYGDRSGYLLYHSFERLGISPMNSYITNAVKCCPERNDIGKYYDIKKRSGLECVQKIKEEIDRIRCSKSIVIGMGRVASNTLKDLGIGHEFIYHPAYYLRKGIWNQFETKLEGIIRS